MLPFPRAHLYVGAFLLATFAAFWPSYFSVLGEASFAHHLHGMTATLWILLLMAQNWTIHHRHRGAHKWFGLSSLALIPVFTVGGLLTTRDTVARDSPFTEMFGFRLAVADLVATVIVCLFFALALRHRRNVHLHARYMLATVTPLLGPSLARLFNNYTPGFAIRSIEELPKFAIGATVSVLFAIALLAILIYRDHRNDQPTLPFTLALIGTLAMYSGFYVWGDWPVWIATMEAYGTVPSWIIWVTGLAIGTAAGAWGWQAGKRPNRRTAAGPAAPLTDATA
ncbi:hypothetical protein [Henriciella sp.]|uniref:hypothetical protein n=1 Tax=Henriciella sp. TaxID=1968823 RepID=UPI0026309FDC|nr:hypothetical protein [Henriciella sp.]